MEKESRYMIRDMHTSIGTVTQVSIRFVEQEKENIKVVVNIQQNTKSYYEYGDKCVGYGRGEKCVYMFTDVGIREMKIH